VNKSITKEILAKTFSSESSDESIKNISYKKTLNAISNSTHKLKNLRSFRSKTYKDTNRRLNNCTDLESSFRFKNNDINLDTTSNSYLLFSNNNVNFITDNKFSNAEANNIENGVLKSQNININDTTVINNSKSKLFPNNSKKFFIPPISKTIHKINIDGSKYNLKHCNTHLNKLYINSCSNNSDIKNKNIKLFGSKNNITIFKHEIDENIINENKTDGKNYKINFKNVKNNIININNKSNERNNEHKSKEKHMNIDQIKTTSSSFNFNTNINNSNSNLLENNINNINEEIIKFHTLLFDKNNNIKEKKKNHLNSKLKNIIKIEFGTTIKNCTFMDKNIENIKSFNRTNYFSTSRKNNNFDSNLYKTPCKPMNNHLQNSNFHNEFELNLHHKNKTTQKIFHNDLISNCLSPVVLSSKVNFYIDIYFFK